VGFGVAPASVSSCWFTSCNRMVGADT
jgi:hypothetical protein